MVPKDTDSTVQSVIPWIRLRESINRKAQGAYPRAFALAAASRNALPSKYLHGSLPFSPEVLPSEVSLSPPHLIKCLYSPLTSTHCSLAIVTTLQIYNGNI